MSEPYPADAPLRPPPPCPTDLDVREWADNLSAPARYGGESADRARERTAVDADGEAAHRFREILLETHNLSWAAKTLAGLTHKALWRNEDTGASISLVKFEQGAGIPSRHSHASNQFMFCLSGRYTYLPTGITLTEGSFYWNPKGSRHGPTLAEETSILLEVYDGPHYPTQPDWYSSPTDAR
ncbi:MULTISPECIES: cupin domain-containing protein [unclassified Crossiella]|uniref:cupin domain-containing protein n=1 Tax=unclassified Crossiella TaxID=2620835 RepID=UPI001FFF1864|nr:MULTISPECIES: cupin domain-containing protein [unclassified Crossiella]MCK2244670.1 cupin domain-containing protein [Crossiella sp. S99.2]MCK2258343.1 cupin domain-containing protein [Crossiella sp. S99.1]